MATFYDREELAKAVESGVVSMTKHPTEDLWIFNYTRGAARDSEKPWDSKTLRQCRGVIMDSDMNFVARPFEKFFNFEELAQLPDDFMPPDTLKLPYTISEKIDGSLGIMYWTKDGPALATRSTFTSEQAIRGTKILREKYGDVVKNFPRNKTFLFEIVYPENKLVVDYGDIEDLFLLAVIDTETGEEENIDGLYPCFLKPCKYVGDWHTVRQKYTDLGEDKNKEGFVVRFSNGYRIKLKFENYFRMRYYTGKLSKRYLIRMLSGGEKTRAELEEIRKHIADTDEEFAAHIESVIQEIYALKDWYLEGAKKRYKAPEEFPSMKEWASYVRSNGRFAPVIFKLHWLADPEKNLVTDAMGRRVEYALEDVLWKLVATHDGIIEDDRDFEEEEYDGQRS